MTSQALEPQLTTEQIQGEYETAFLAYRAAQARLAYAGAFLAVDAWSTMIRPTSFAKSLSRWLDFVVTVVRRIRVRQRRLAQAYYQYHRALHTGTTLGPPLAGTGTRLADYRAVFTDQLNDVATLESTTPGSWDDEDDMTELRQQLRSILTQVEDERSTREQNFRSITIDDAIQRFLDNWETDGSQAIEVEDFAWPDRDADSADKAHRDHFEELALDLWKAEEQAMDAEEALGDTDSKKSKRQSIADRLEAASQTIGNRVAGRVMAATSHAADQVTNWALDRDQRYLGVARGTGPNPCAMCAAAAAQGFVYKSVSSAMTTGSGGVFKRYHDNCQCYPIIKWVESQPDPATTTQWAGIYNQAKAKPGNTFNNFRQMLHARNAEHINERRRQYYAQNKDRINARRRAARRQRTAG